MVDEALIAAIRAALAAGGNPERAAGQQRYMKSALPYHGLTSPELRTTLRPLLAQHTLPDADAWRATVRALWDAATHREERYAAIALLRHRAYRAWATHPDPATVALLRHLVETGAWWDLVDELASHCVGDLLRAAPDVMTPILRAWAVDGDLWVRRSAILSQLGSKDATDTALLSHAIAGSLHDPDFFARKAIGWALREYAKTDPAWVRHFVEDHRDRLSGLSVREAAKHLAT